MGPVASALKHRALAIRSEHSEHSGIPVHVARTYLNLACTAAGDGGPTEKVASGNSDKALIRCFMLSVTFAQVRDVVTNSPVFPDHRQMAKLGTWFYHFFWTSHD